MSQEKSICSRRASSDSTAVTSLACFSCLTADPVRAPARRARGGRDRNRRVPGLARRRDSTLRPLDDRLRRRP